MGRLIVRWPFKRRLQRVWLEGLVEGLMAQSETGFVPWEEIRSRIKAEPEDVRAVLMNELAEWERKAVIASTPARRISSPPGRGLLAIAEFLFSARSLETVLKPTIDDLRSEYNQALFECRNYKAKWIRVRGTWSFLSAAGLLAFSGFGKLVVRVWRLIG
ncbi:MAG TPA: hypothetical protein VFJ82_10505 [Longimicrobium sp.]|nr:hypothetical protein [Longimicrobium sp.]